MFKTIVYISLKLDWKYTKFCRQTATYSGYLCPKLESSQSKNTAFMLSYFKFVIAIIKFVIFTVTSTHTTDHQFVNATPI